MSHCQNQLRPVRGFSIGRAALSARVGWSRPRAIRLHLNAALQGNGRCRGPAACWLRTGRADRPAGSRRSSTARCARTRRRGRCSRTYRSAHRPSCSTARWLCMLRCPPCRRNHCWCCRTRPASRRNMCRRGKSARVWDRHDAPHGSRYVNVTIRRPQRCLVVSWCRRSPQRHGNLSDARSRAAGTHRA